MPSASRMLAAAAVLGPSSAGVQERFYDWGWGMHPMWWMWGVSGIVTMLLMLVFWAALITAVVLGVRWLLRQGRGEARDPALDILRQRYARGEIDREEFEARRRDLEH